MMSTVSDTLNHAAEELRETLDSGNWHVAEPQMKQVADDMEALATRLERISEEEENEMANIRARGGFRIAE